jgi:hypothetical protein
MARGSGDERCGPDGVDKSERPSESRIIDQNPMPSNTAREFPRRSDMLGAEGNVVSYGDSSLARTPVLYSISIKVSIVA